MFAHLLRSMGVGQIQAQTPEFIDKNKRLDWKDIFIYMLLFDCSLTAEEREERVDSKVRTAAPPLTPQQTVSFAR